MNETSDLLISDQENVVLSTSKKKYSAFRTSMDDCWSGFLQWKLWLYLAYADIRRRYRRTIIGPFWATLSIAIFIGAMGVVFSTLWHQKIDYYLPFFASGFIVWNFFSTMVTESCSTFISMENYMKQVSLPYHFYAFLLVSRNIMLFLHQFVVFLFVAFIFHVHITPYTFLAIPGFLLLILNCCWISVLLGFLCARFRDVQQIITSILQIAMFITPIFWAEFQLGNGKLASIIIDINPIYHFISVVRYSLLGEPARLISWFFDILILFVGWIFTMVFLSRHYHKLIYWL